jgi:hypothetical protein
MGNGSLIGDNGYPMDTKVCGFEIGDDLDRVSKVLYSTVLADLGAADSGPNLLADHTNLKAVLAGLGNSTLYNNNSRPADISYAQLDADKDNLAITSATFYYQYMCQVPLRKNAGSMLIGIIVADLVFLQAAWHLLIWGTSFGLKHKNPSANLCEGCTKSRANEQTAIVEMLGLMDDSPSQSLGSTFEIPRKPTVTSTAYEALSRQPSVNER